MSERMTLNKKKKGIRKHGFMARIKTLGGRKVVKRRREKGRKRV